MYNFTKKYRSFLNFCNDKIWISDLTAARRNYKGVPAVATGGGLAGRGFLHIWCDFIYLQYTPYTKNDFGLWIIHDRRAFGKSKISVIIMLVLFNFS